MFLLCRLFFTKTRKQRFKTSLS